MEIYDNELVYLYRESKNNYAYYLLEDKYLEQLKLIGFKYLNSTYIFTFYSKDDVESLIKNYFIDGCNCFEYHKTKFKFKPFIFTYVRNKFLDHCKTFSRNTHLILNISKSYDDFSNKNSCYYSDEIEKTPEYLTNKEFLRDQQIEWVMNFLDKKFKKEKNDFLKWIYEDCSNDVLHDKKISRMYYIRHKLKTEYKKNCRNYDLSF